MKKSEQYRSRLRIALFLIASAAPLSGEIGLTEDGSAFVEGDVKFRYENHDTDRPGTERQERGRITSHLVLGYRLEDSFTFRVGGRTGSLNNQHTPTVTVWNIKNSKNGTRSYYVDRWEAVYKKDGWQAIAGRTLNPFWSATGYIWDGDINPAGGYLAHIWTHDEKKDGETTLAGAYFALPDGGLDFSGEAAIAQVQHVRPLGEGKLTAALQWMQIDGASSVDHGRAAGNLRDYGIGQISMAYKLPLFGQPFSAGFDLFKNFEDYGAGDPFGQANDDEDTGYGIGLSWGQNKQAGDWRLRYNYTYQEALGSSPSVSEDTFSRLGTTNYKGHGFRVIYSILDNLTVMGRLMLSEEIKGDADAHRFRIDTKYSF